MMTAEGGVGPRALYFEDFRPGDRYAGGAHLMTKAEILEFARRFDPQIFHVDTEAARDSIFGGLVASGLHTFCVSSRLFADLGIYHGTLLGGAEIENLRFLLPVRPGGTLRIEAEVITARPSRTKLDRGILHMAINAFNQRDEMVLSCTSLEFLKRRNRGTPPQA